MLIRGAIANAAQAQQVNRVRQQFAEILQLLRDINKVDENILRELGRRK